MANDVQQETAEHLITQCYSRILDDGLAITADEVRRNTPRRAAKALLDLTTPTPFKLAWFKEPGAEHMVCQNGIWLASLCEHHLLPFFGYATVAYLPLEEMVVGLSKLARLVKFHAAGLRTQERITVAIGQQLVRELNTAARRPVTQPASVAVSLRCYHTCMAIRGVKDHSACTQTEFLSGQFKSDPATRQEFLMKVSHPPVFG